MEKQRGTATAVPRSVSGGDTAQGVGVEATAAPDQVK